MPEEEEGVLRADPFKTEPNAAGPRAHGLSSALTKPSLECFFLLVLYIFLIPSLFGVAWPLLT